MRKFETTESLEAVPSFDQENSNKNKYVAASLLVCAAAVAGGIYLANKVNDNGDEQPQPSPAPTYSQPTQNFEQSSSEAEEKIAKLQKDLAGAQKQVADLKIDKQKLVETNKQNESSKNEQINRLNDDVTSAKQQQNNLQKMLDDANKRNQEISTNISGMETSNQYNSQQVEQYKKQLTELNSKYSDSQIKLDDALKQKKDIEQKYAELNKKYQEALKTNKN